MNIGYARCSTASQAASLDGQIRYLKETMCAEIVYSEIVSGRKTERKELARLMYYAREGDIVVVQRLDRLARSVPELIRITTELNDRGINLRSGHENLDTNSAAGRLIFHIFCSLAEFEAELVRERTLVGLENARAKGRKGGRPKKLDDGQVAILKAAKEARAMSVRKLAKQYKISVSTLYDYVSG